jgi:hypothetical protein
MTLELPAHLQEKIAATQTAHIKPHTMFATLTNADVATSAQFWMQHCRTPRHVQPGIPVWDSTFWHHRPGNDPPPAAQPSRSHASRDRVITSGEK